MAAEPTKPAPVHWNITPRMLRRACEIDAHADIHNATAMARSRLAAEETHDDFDALIVVYIELFVSALAWPNM